MCLIPSAITTRSLIPSQASLQKSRRSSLFHLLNSHATLGVSQASSIYEAQQQRNFHDAPKALGLRGDGSLPLLHSITPVRPHSGPSPPPHPDHLPPSHARCPTPANR